jgi:hypothetical protein
LLNATQEAKSNASANIAAHHAGCRPPRDVDLQGLLIVACAVGAWPMQVDSTLEVAVCRHLYHGMCAVPTHEQGCKRGWWGGGRGEMRVRGSMSKQG